MSQQNEYVYLIECPALGTTKIGKAVDPEIRIGQLQTGNPTKLRLFHVILSDDPFRLETMLHHHYRRQHVYLEWYSLTGQDKLDIVYNIGNVCNSKDLDYLEEHGFSSMNNSLLRWLFLAQDALADPIIGTRIKVILGFIAGAVAVLLLTSLL